MSDFNDANRDPLTNEPGAHPVGTGVGAMMGGAAAGAAAGDVLRGQKVGPGWSGRAQGRRRPTDGRWRSGLARGKPCRRMHAPQRSLDAAIWGGQHLHRHLCQALRHPRRPPDHNSSAKNLAPIFRRKIEAD